MIPSQSFWKRRSTHGRKFVRTNYRPMKQLPLISSALYATPWMILPATHAELGRLYQAYLRGELAPLAVLPAGFELDDDEDDEDDLAPCDLYAGCRLVVIEVAGIIGKRVPDMPCGPAVADLARIDAALAKYGPEAETIVLDFDTPGGSSLGLPETAARLRALREAGTRLVAYTDTECCSAGYYLAAECDEIMAAPSALIGCIGTYIAAVDSSRQFELSGLDLKLFRDGAIKAIGTDGKRWTPEEEAFLQQMVDASSAEFKGLVRERRPGVSDADMQGQWWPAASAPRALRDGLALDLESVLVEELGRLV